ncbi:MAG: YfhO family protein [Oscillospiraceae bacterium]|nr:YfhO family protein [Oscillospiraceae bacterium]
MSDNLNENLQSPESTSDQPATVPNPDNAESGMVIQKINVTFVDGSEPSRDNINDTKSGAEKKKARTLNPNSPLGKLLSFVKKHRIYFATFFIPALILFGAYAAFGVHPFGDMSVLVLDLNGQYVYYYENLRDALHGDGSLFISFSRNLSGEIVGMFAYYLASPFVLIPMLLPRSMMTESLLIMQLCKVGTAAVTFFYYLKHSKNCKKHTCLIFSMMYALMGYVIVQLMNPMWLDGLIYLPLIIIGIERIINENRLLPFIVPLALMFMAHFYIGWMIAFFCIIYFIYYYFAGNDNPSCSFVGFVKSGFRFAVGGLTAAASSAWVLIPLYYSLKLGKFEFSTPDYTLSTQFDFIDFFKNLLPNIYDTCRPEGSPVVFCGVLTMVMLPLFFLNGKISFRQKMGMGGVLLAVLLSMYLSTVDLAWHGFQVPNWLPYRYSFTFSFIMLVMAAMTFERLEGISIKEIGVTCFGLIVYAFYVGRQDFDGVSLVLSVWYSVIFTFIYGVFLRFMKVGTRKKAAVLSSIMVIFIAAELFGTTLSTLEAIDDDVVYSKYSSYNRYITLGRETVQQIYDTDTSPFYRIEKDYHRTVNDAMAMGNYGISHSSSTLNSAPIQFLRRLGFSYGGHYIKYKGATYVTDAILGIKYVMEKGDAADEDNPEPEAATSKQYDDLVLTNGDDEEIWYVYENPNALSLGFMADYSILDVTCKDDNVFLNQNKLLSALVSDEYTEYFKRISVQSVVPENAVQTSYGSHTKYTPEVEGKNSHIEFIIEAPTTDMIYFYMPSNYERRVNLWLNREFLDYYYEGGYMCVQTLGRFDEGEEISLIVTITEDKNEVLYSDKLFYYLDEELFSDAISTLKEHEWDITEFSEDHIKGTITAEEDGIMFTSISWEPGWEITVDGEMVEPVELVDALIGIELTAGEHVVEMNFFPEGMTEGIILSIAGIIVIIIVAISDPQKKKPSKAAVGSDEGEI